MGQSSLVVHNFNERLRYSQQASAESFWNRVYTKAFPDMVNHMPCNGNTLSQRLGIDRVIHLSSGRTLYIDEKKREKVYSDILLEYISNDSSGTPGWMDKDLQIDYLAYAFMPTKRVYLFDWLMLRRAWLQYKDTWLNKYERIPAKNEGYTTWSVAVPIPVLHKAVRTATIIQLGDTNG